MCHDDGRVAHCDHYYDDETECCWCYEVFGLSNYYDCWR